MKIYKKTKFFGTYVLAILLGIDSVAFAASTAVPAGGVQLENTFKVGNVTQNVDYTDAVNAKIDDVVRYEIWYHDNEPSNSGKKAEDLKIKVSLPTAMSTSHVATAVVGGSNTNTITNSATVNTSTATTLAYIPGTAFRRHNIGTNAAPVWSTEKISDSVMSATGFTIDNMNPCWNFQETITVQARVMASVVSINKQVKIEGTDGWKASVDAKPGDTVAYLITIKDEGNTELTNVMVRDNLPPRMEFIPGSAVLTNSNFPNGKALSDLLIQGGDNTGNYSPGGVGYIRFTAKVPTAVDKCMNGYEFNNVGVVKPEGMEEFYNTAKVLVNYPCSTTPSFTATLASTAPSALPTSGPVEAAAGAVGLTAASGAGYVWLKSKKSLLSALKKIK